MEGNKYTLKAVNVQLKADKVLALKNYWMNRYYLSKQIWDSKVTTILDSTARLAIKEKLIEALNLRYRTLCDEYFNKSQLEFKKWERLIDSLKTEETQEGEEGEESEEGEIDLDSIQ